VNLKNVYKLIGARTARKLGVFVVCVLVLVGVASRPDVVRADPHGIYYTVVGQSQLFFNVLAALNQTDYVESALTREKRREAREQIDAEQPFVRESESGARFTVETELEQDDPGSSPSDPGTPGERALINRQVTLEGGDLYTDQLVRQFGAEFARRNAASELLQALCENGFGLRECQYDMGEMEYLDIHKLERKRAAAGIVNPLEWASLPYWNGTWAALNSGNAERNIVNPHPDDLHPITGDPDFPYLNDEEYRAGKAKSPYIFGFEPLAYSPEVAAWRRTIENRGLTSYDLSGHNDLMATAMKGVNNMVVSEKPAIYPFQEVEFLNANGDFRLVGISYSPSDCGNAIPCLDPNAPPWSIAKQPGMSLVRYIEITTDLMSQGNRRLAEIAGESAQRIEKQLQLIEDEGMLARTHLQANPVDPSELYGTACSGDSGVCPQSDYGELSLIIDSPVAVRQGSVYGIPNVLGMLATSQQASSLEGLDIPGSVQLVKRGSTEGSPSPPPPSPRSALPSDSSGQVAGTLDVLFGDRDSLFDEKRRETSPSANIISPILEFGAKHALRVITAGRWRWSLNQGYGCGFTCD
jgi:hypothetical protein